MWHYSLNKHPKRYTIDLRFCLVICSHIMTCASAYNNSEPSQNSEELPSTRFTVKNTVATVWLNPSGLHAGALTWRSVKGVVVCWIPHDTFKKRNYPILLRLLVWNYASLHSRWLCNFAVSMDSMFVSHVTYTLQETLSGGTPHSGLLIWQCVMLTQTCCWHRLGITQTPLPLFSSRWSWSLIFYHYVWCDYLTGRAPVVLWFLRASRKITVRMVVFDHCPILGLLSRYVCLDEWTTSTTKFGRGTLQ